MWLIPIAIVYTQSKGLIEKDNYLKIIDKIDQLDPNNSVDFWQELSLCIKSENPNVRRHAVRATLGDTSKYVLNFLFSLNSEPDNQVKMEILKSASMHRRREAYYLIESYYLDKNIDVRRYAFQLTLDYLPICPSLVKENVEKFSETIQDEKILSYIVSIYGVIGHKDDIPFLLSLFNNSENMNLRNSAKTVILKIDKKAISSFECAVFNISLFLNRFNIFRLWPIIIVALPLFFRRIRDGIRKILTNNYYFFLRMLAFLPYGDRFVLRKYKNYLYRNSNTLKNYFTHVKIGDLEDIYIPLSTTGFIDNKKEDRVIYEGIELLDKKGLNIILGAPGCGKTTLCNWLLIHITKGKRNPKLRSVLPIYIPLHAFAARLKNDDELDLKNLCKEKLIRYIGENVDNILVKHLKSGKICVFLDGLDEVGETTHARVVRSIEEFIEWMESHSTQNRIFLTCRTTSYHNELAGSTNLIFEIDPLPVPAVTKFITNIEYGEDKNSEKLLSLLDTAPQILEICRTPLMLAILVSLYIEQKAFALPKYRSEFYQRIIQEMLERHERTRISSLSDRKYERDQLSIFLEVIAFISFYRNKSRDFSSNIFDQIIEDSALMGQLKQRAIKVEDFQSLMNEIFSHTGLLQKGENFYFFCHRSIQEYLAALVVASQSGDDDFVDAFVQKINSDVSHYIAMIEYYSNLSNIDHERIFKKFIPLNNPTLLFTFVGFCRYTTDFMIETINAIISNYNGLELTLCKTEVIKLALVMLNSLNQAIRNTGNKFLAFILKNSNNDEIINFIEYFRFSSQESTTTLLANSLSITNSPEIIRKCGFNLYSISSLQALKTFLEIFLSNPKQYGELAPYIFLITHRRIDMRELLSIIDKEKIDSKYFDRATTIPIYLIYFKERILDHYKSEFKYLWAIDSAIYEGIAYSDQRKFPLNNFLFFLRGIDIISIFNYFYKNHVKVPEYEFDAKHKKVADYLLTYLADVINLLNKKVKIHPIVNFFYFFISPYYTYFELNYYERHRLDKFATLWNMYSRAVRQISQEEQQLNAFMNENYKKNTLRKKILNFSYRFLPTSLFFLSIKINFFLGCLIFGTILRPINTFSVFSWKKYWRKID